MVYLTVIFNNLAFFLFCLGFIVPLENELKMSALPVNDCKFWPLLDTHGHWAMRDLKRATPSVTRSNPLWWSSLRTCDTHSWFRAFASRAANTYFSDLYFQFSFCPEVSLFIVFMYFTYSIFYLLSFIIKIWILKLLFVVCLVRAWDCLIKITFILIRCTKESRSLFYQSTLYQWFQKLFL